MISKFRRQQINLSTTQEYSKFNFPIIFVTYLVFFYFTSSTILHLLLDFSHLLRFLCSLSSFYTVINWLFHMFVYKISLFGMLWFKNISPSCLLSSWANDIETMSTTPKKKETFVWPNYIFSLKLDINEIGG